MQRIKQKKTIFIIILTITTTILVSLTLYIWAIETDTTTKKEVDIAYIGELEPIRDIIVFNERAIIKTDKELFELDNNEKKLTKIIQPKGNFILSKDNSKVYLCQWENFIINNPEQIATITKVYTEKTKFLYQDETSKTSMPTFCDDITIHYTDAFPFQPNHSPKVLPNKLTFMGSHNTTLLIDDKTIAEDLPIENIFISGYTSDNRKSAILQDNSGGIWLVEIPP